MEDSRLRPHPSTGPPPTQVMVIVSSCMTAALIYQLKHGTSGRPSIAMRLVEVISASIFLTELFVLFQKLITLSISLLDNYYSTVFSLFLMFFVRYNVTTSIHREALSKPISSAEKRLFLYKMFLW